MRLAATKKNSGQLCQSHSGAPLWPANAAGGGGAGVIVLVWAS